MRGSGRETGLRFAAAAAVAFGLLTIASGGTVLFGGQAGRDAGGRYVPFVLWFNFLAGFFYAGAGVGLWAHRRWAVWLALGIAVGTLAVSAAFCVHVLLGGAFEPRTPAALVLRVVVWVVIFAYAYRRLVAAA